jgi:hypothetical protein
MSIEELQKKLDHWRKSKTNHRERIPLEYWEAAVRLTNDFSPSCAVRAQSSQSRA